MKMFLALSKNIQLLKLKLKHIPNTHNDYESNVLSLIFCS